MGRVGYYADRVPQGLEIVGGLNRGEKIMQTVRKNTKIYKNAIANAQSIKVFTLENNFIGEPVKLIDSFYLEMGKLFGDSGRYKLHVHSNCWYEFSA